MLAEIAVYLTTPCPRAHRRAGHLRAAVDLWSRAGRCAAAWAPHYARCHEVVAAAVRDLPARRKALVLGSGLLRDVPVRALERQFRSVILVDVVHLSTVRLAGLLRPRLTFVIEDLARLDGPDPLARFRADPEIDLVVSANVLSQLPLVPAAAAERARAPDPSRAVVERHLAGLSGFAGRVCLLTDTAQLTVGRDGRECDRIDLVEGVELPPTPHRWRWTLAPFGEDAPGHALVHEARGYPDLAAALAGGRATR